MKLTFFRLSLRISPMPSRRSAYVGRASARSAMGGFSLVEILVALLIGLIGIVVMMQVFSLFEGQRRTATSGDDAIGTGSISLYGIQRDLQRAGWGISAPPMIGCTITGLVQGGASIPLVPVAINPESSPGVPLIPGADSFTEVLMISSGNGNGSVEGEQIKALAGTDASFQAAATFGVNDSVVFAFKDRPASCDLSRDTVTAVAAPVVSLTTGGAGLSFTTKDSLFNLGVAPTVRVYRVRNQVLAVCDYVDNNCGATGSVDDPDVWLPVANNIVSLRAQYGRDSSAPMDGVPDVWDRTIPVPAAKGGFANYQNGCAWIRAAAVRLVLVARSSQPEKPNEQGKAHVTSTAPVWAGSDELAVSIDSTEAADIGLTLPSPDPSWPTWQDFRYKVFQTIVPLRNITIQGVPSEC